MLVPAVGRRRNRAWSHALGAVINSSKVSPMTHSLTQGCPICQGTLQPLSVMPRLKTARCPSCGHRVATHESETSSILDYHLQYGQGVFLDSLPATRKRQAECIIQAIRRALPDCDQVLDYGAGRG